MESAAIGYAIIVCFALYYRNQGDKRLQDLTLFIGNRLLILFASFELLEYTMFYRSEYAIVKSDIDLGEIYTDFFLFCLFLMLMYKCFSLIFVLKSNAKSLLLSIAVSLLLLLDAPFWNLRPFFDVESLFLTWDSFGNYMNEQWLDRYTYLHIFIGNTAFVVLWLFIFAYFQLKEGNLEGKGLEIEKHLVE